MLLSDARVLVTGGSSGIGRATARRFVQAGARVAICGRDAGRLREAAEATGATPIVADVADEASVVRLVGEVRDVLGGYDTLINNAGVGGFAPLVDTTAELMRRLWETNVLGATLVARESARHFVAQRRGTIVNVASTAGSRGFANGSAYSSTKFAVTSLTECWRAELRQHDVRVMQVNPSEVVTNFFAAAGGAQQGNETKLQPEDIAETIASMVGLPDRAFVTEATVWATNPRNA